MEQMTSALAVLAGNSRVQRDSYGIIIVEAQLLAFEAALKLARKELDSGMPLPTLSVAFDHHGIFRTQFLAENLSNSQKRHPRLSHLHSSIQHVFRPVAEKYAIALSDIHAIHEDSARQHLTHLLSTQEIPERLSRRILHESPAQPNADKKLTCAAITKEYFERAVVGGRKSCTQLEVFFEECKWSESLAYVRGLQLSHLLGVSARIRLNLVNISGEIIQGEWTFPRSSSQGTLTSPYA